MIGEKLGPFLIESKLGQGAMGVVYKAVYEPTGLPAAIKVIHQDQARRNNAVDRFQRESDILKQFRHPNIVQHIGVGYSKKRDMSYYAMEFVSGRTLDEVLEERGPLPWTEAVELGHQMCEALHYAHERGVIHRDFKPSNLLITPSGQVKLTDFGIAKDLDRTALTATGRTLGTAAYMAPEQIRGVPEVSHRTDLYALGCVLYQMLTGVPPYEGPTAIALMHKHLEEPPPRPSGKNPEIPVELDKLVVRLMAKDRDDRPWDALAVLQQLGELREKAARGEAVPMVFGGIPKNPPRAGTEVTTSRDATSQKTRKLRRMEPSGSFALSVRQMVEIGLLIAALGVCLSLMAYLLWPPSAKYLYQRAAEGMAKKERSDWILTRDQYINELERRFPHHPYREEVQEWKDKILLDQANGRARYLENPNPLAASKPKTDAEAAYQRVFIRAAKEEEAGHDLDVVQGWKALTATIPDHGEDRMWFLLAKQRTHEVESSIQKRIDAVNAQLIQAKVADQAGHGDQAVQIRRELIDRYGAYQSLRNQLEEARVGLPRGEPSETRSDPKSP